jgi:putative cell wall-binding protein
MHQLEHCDEHRRALKEKAGILEDKRKGISVFSGKGKGVSSALGKGEGIPSRQGVRSSIASSVTSVTYTNKIASGEAHIYFFTVVEPGTVHITNNGSSASVGFALVDDASDDPKPIQDGDTLPAGHYRFVVYSATENAVPYSFSVGGVSFYGTPNNTLPGFTVTKTQAHDLTLPLNTFSLKMEGTHSAEEAGLYANFSPAPIVLGKHFSQTVSLSPGYNFLHLEAYNASGNAVYEDYYLTAPGVMRIDGANRYEMAANLSKRMFPWGTDTVVITRGDVFTDALSGGALASLEGAPLLFSDFASQSLPVPVQNEIKRLKSEEAIILGGTDSVSSRVVSQLKAIGVTDVERIGGANRFAVSANVANHVFTRVQALSPNQRPDTVIIASGLVFPDALAGGPFAASIHSSLLLTPPDALDPHVATHLKNVQGRLGFYVLGGPDSVSPNVAGQLKNMTKPR